MVRAFLVDPLWLGDAERFGRQGTPTRYPLVRFKVPGPCLGPIAAMSRS